MDMYFKIKSNNCKSIRVQLLASNTLKSNNNQ